MQSKRGLWDINMLDNKSEYLYVHMYIPEYDCEFLCSCCMLDN